MPRLSLTFPFLESDRKRVPPSSDRETFFSSDSSLPPAGPLEPKWKGAASLEGDAASDVDWLLDDGDAAPPVDVGEAE